MLSKAVILDPCRYFITLYNTMSYDANRGVNEVKMKRFKNSFRTLWKPFGKVYYNHGVTESGPKKGLRVRADCSLVGASAAAR